MSNIAGLSLGTNSIYEYSLNTGNINNTSANKLEETIGTTDLEHASEDKLFEVCKSFEAYFVEQVFKEMKKSVSSEEDGEYTKYFGEMLTQQYAEQTADTGELGIAQMLYESMKRNGVS